MLGNSVYRRLVVAGSAAGMCLVASPLASGDEAQTPDVAYVSEDWVLVLNEPASSVSCPQFHTIMSPTTDLASRYFQVNWNYQEQPSFASGGLELLNWSGETLLQHKTVKTEELSTTAETITWTQSLFTNGTIFGFMISSGNSTTWGVFGTSSWGGTPGLHDLNGYSPDVSTANAWITYGSNRVDLLKMVQVRYFDADGNLLRTDDTPRIVFQASQ